MAHQEEEEGLGTVALGEREEEEEEEGNSPSSSAACLEIYVELLEKRAKQLRNQFQGKTSEDAAIERVKEAIAAGGLQSHKFRASLLGCTEEQLTKVIIVENKVTDAVDCSDPHNSLYYMVVVQYVARLSDVMLRKVVSELKPLEQRLTKKKFNLQVAPEDVVLKLIGFAHNGVCPLGGKVRIPVIVDSAVRDVEKGFIWMGGGNPFLKLGLALEDFLHAAAPVAIAKITNPR